MATYSPTATEIVHTTKVDFRRRPIVEAIHLMQYDNGIPVIAAELYSDGLSFQAPSGSTIKLRFNDRHGATVYSSALGTDSTGHVVYFRVTSEMTRTSGARFPVIELTYGDARACSSSIPIIITSGPKYAFDDQKLWLFKEGAGINPEIEYTITGTGAYVDSQLQWIYFPHAGLTNAFTFTISDARTKLFIDLQRVDTSTSTAYSMRLLKNGTRFAELTDPVYREERTVFESDTAFDPGDTLRIVNYFGIWHVCNLWLE